MAININGNNYGIAVDGNLTIGHVDFGFGGGVQSASGIHREGLAHSLPSMAESTLQSRTNGIISLRPCWKLACADNLWATKSLWSR